MKFFLSKVTQFFDVLKKSGFKKAFNDVFDFFWKRLWIIYPTNFKKWVYPKRLQFNCLVSSMITKGSFTLLTKYLGPYRIIDIADVGFGSRDIQSVSVKNKNFVMTADTGSNSVSTLRYENQSLDRLTTLEFPDLSAPIGIESLNLDSSSKFPSILFELFNYDRDESKFSRTVLSELQDVRTVLSHIDSPGQKLDTLQLREILGRKGHWGFRSLNKYEDEKSYFLVVVDRGGHLIHFLRVPRTSGGLDDFESTSISIGTDSNPSEPIYAGMIPCENSVSKFDLLLSQRARPSLKVLRGNAQKLVEHQEISLSGKSRSSVAVGNFRDMDRHDAALAIWGDDPANDFDTVTRGKVAVFLNDGEKFNSIEFDAGIHPTDVVAGDYDGDGLDELAVLNYGTGQSSQTRTKSGGVDIYKFMDGEFVKKQELWLPTPRIGWSGDLNDDGRDELLIALFFERKLALIQNILD